MGDTLASNIKPLETHGKAMVHPRVTHGRPMSLYYKPMLDPWVSTMNHGRPMMGYTVDPGVIHAL